MAKFQINILGCGSATPSARHMPSCQVIDFRDRLMMIDCGEGAQMQFRRMSLKFSRLSHIFISHLHGDHLFGLPGLLSTMALHDAVSRITIHILEEGVPLLRSWLDTFLRDSGLEVIYDPIVAGESRVLLDEKALTVECFPLYHRVPCTGFIFREKEKSRHLDGEMAAFLNLTPTQRVALKAGRSITHESGRIYTPEMLTTPPEPAVSYAYCSDTLADNRVADAIAGVDTVYHEATYDDSLRALAMQRGHSTALQAARIARRAGARQLILGHFSKRYESEDVLLEEARTVMDNVIIAREGMKIDLL
ncbi:MAG: ribonuclease Z [Bacteroides sp.]|nr:ribonuclease Z [Bacteroidales bacterium]MBD5251298.1 ribonuclease Z [Barnesiella sp.]MBD5368015.1 ribonuclease Z [Bacteroides sp.]